MNRGGIVYLVGAGPGDPGLLTLRGAELLRKADVVVYDRLISPELLRLARDGAELIYAGKKATSQAISQAELNRILVDRALQGQCVVRLKGGDPYVFGRGGEEAEALADSGIGFEVVPGVSSASAVPNYAGIPLTHRLWASSFTVVTGHEDPAKDKVRVDWSRIAQAPGTKVILMGVLRLREIAELLVDHGMDPATPAAVIRWGTTARQQVVEGTLATIAEAVEQVHLKPPALIVVGDTVRLRNRLNWFEKRPLFGQRVVVTRARDQASGLADAFRAQGAEVLELPAIKIAPPSDKESLKDAILGLNQYDWILFTSPNGVTCFFDWFFKGFDDLRDLGGARLAAVGPGTAARLRELHLQVDLMPDEHTGASLADALAAHQTIENLKILLMRAEVANRELPMKLEKLGAIVDDVACYRTIAEGDVSDAVVTGLLQTGADWVTFTSASTVEHFHQRIDLRELMRRFPQLKLASIGPETTHAVESIGLKPAVEASPHTAEGLVDSILRQQNR